MDMLRYNYATLLKRSKNRQYRQMVHTTTLVLMTFLKENELILFDPFREDGSVKPDLVVRTSHLIEWGNRLFRESFPKWSHHIDSGKPIEDIRILQRDLAKFKTEQPEENRRKKA